MSFPKHSQNCLIPLLPFQNCAFMLLSQFVLLLNWILVLLQKRLSLLQYNLLWYTILLLSRSFNPCYLFSDMLFSLYDTNSTSWTMYVTPWLIIKATPFLVLLFSLKEILYPFLNSSSPIPLYFILLNPIIPFSSLHNMNNLFYCFSKHYIQCSNSKL